MEWLHKFNYSQSHKDQALLRETLRKRLTFQNLKTLLLTAVDWSLCNFFIHVFFTLTSKLFMLSQNDIGFWIWWAISKVKVIM